MMAQVGTMTGRREGPLGDAPWEIVDALAWSA